MNAVLYIHGKDGSATECAHYKPLFPYFEVMGLDYQTFTPWETGKEIRIAVEKLKTKYLLENGLPLDDEARASIENSTQSTETTETDSELVYFQRKVRAIERKERQEKQKLSLKDFFKKREKPQFHYVSRFDSEGNIIETPREATKDSTVKRRINRRFEDDDMDRFKPIPAGKIMI